jgi:formylmethanofuran dehydrogenase subunit E
MSVQTRVCGRSIEDFLTTIEKFHGWKAPGVVIGGFMVDLARERIGTEVEADAIVETTHCLGDAIQLFTPCTYGNGWMKVVDWDKFALTLYDKKTLEGVRVWLDLEKARNFPNIYNWYMRLVPKRDLPLDVLLQSILNAGRDMLWQKQERGNCCLSRMRRSVSYPAGKPLPFLPGSRLFRAGKTG